jgi:uncharacterized protein (UPF0332 family)
MSRENILALVQYRLEQADTAVRAAHVLLAQDFLRDAVSRSYYGMFYTVLALLVTKQLGTSKSQSALALFDREFIRTGIFDRELSAWLHKACEMRLDADYKELVTIPRKEVRKALHQAELFVSRVKVYLNDLLADAGGAEDAENEV